MLEDFNSKSVDVKMNDQLIPSLKLEKGLLANEIEKKDFFF